MDCNKPVTTLPLRELPIDTLESLPDYLLTERDIQDVETGNTLATITRTPAAKLFPNGNLSGVVPLVTNNNTLTIPNRQVVPCYVSTANNAITIMKADGSHKAMFLAFSTFGEDQVLVKHDGFLTLMDGHSYIIGVKYYLSSTAGEVTTDSTQTGQYLFTPVSSTTLAVGI